MKMKNAGLEISGQLGYCGNRKVFVGFAAAALLAKISFPDLLDENTGRGYQRRFHRDHSLEFKRYIQQPGASTIPLTFNLRPTRASDWSLTESADLNGAATLCVIPGSAPVMAQVDCQHRLGYLADSPIQFAFMAYIGLSVEEEIEIFRVINGKAKGLSGSLLDFTEAKLSADGLSSAKPELFIALQLQQDPASPWYQRLDLGGTTVGTKRQASLRTMQRAAKRFLKEAKLPPAQVPDLGPKLLINFWKAIAYVLPKEWNDPRGHMLTKGIGVYSLMSFAGIVVREAATENKNCDLDYFIAKLSDFIHHIDWSNHGPLHGYGGASGADAVLALLMQLRRQTIGAPMSYA